MQKILHEMITKDAKLLASTVGICSNSIKYLGGFLELMDTMPNLEYVVLFFKNLILIASMMIGQDPDSIDVEPYVRITLHLIFLDKIRETETHSDR